MAATRTAEEQAAFKEFLKQQANTKKKANNAAAAELELLKQKAQEFNIYKKTIETEKAAANAAAKKQKEEEISAAKQKQDDANAVKQGKIRSLRKEVYKNGPVAFRASDKQSSSPSSFIISQSVLVVDKEYYIKTTSEPCNYCNALLLLPNETIANHKPECMRYNQKLYEAYVNWIRQQGNVIKNKSLGKNNTNLKPLEQLVTAAKDTFDKLLEEYKKDPTLVAKEAAAEAATEAADKPAFMVGSYGSKHDGYRAVTKDDISQPLFGKILQYTHLNRDGLDTFDKFNVRYELHAAGGKFMARTHNGTFRNSYSTISCRNQITREPKIAGELLRDVTKYFFYITDGSKNFDNAFKIEESTVEEQDKRIIPCLFIYEKTALTEPPAAESAAAAPLKKGGKQKRNKTHRKYYARRNKKHTRRH